MYFVICDCTLFVLLAYDPFVLYLFKLTNTYSASMVKFKGPKWTWIRPTTYEELLKLKTNFPDAPVIMGNTTAGNMKTDDTHFDIISERFKTIVLEKH